MPTFFEVIRGKVSLEPEPSLGGGLISARGRLPFPECWFPATGCLYAGTLRSLVLSGGRGTCAVLGRESPCPVTSRDLCFLVFSSSDSSFFFIFFFWPRGLGPSP